MDVPPKVRTFPQRGGPTVRTALHAQHRYGYRFLPELQPLLDEGVALDPAAGTGPLARALFDRASALTAALRYTDAGADFREARALRAARR
ncbi:hypothetical protein [Streptomyces sp. NPDC054794]